MNEHDAPPGKIKFHVRQHSPDKDGRVRIEFTPLFGGLGFSTTVPEAQAEAEIQKHQGWVKGREDRDREIARQLYGDPDADPLKTK